MQHSHQPHSVALICGVAALVACEPTRDEPSAPQAAALSQATQAEPQPFYYFRPSRNAPDIRIPLELDPTELVVAAVSQGDAEAAVSARGLTVVSTTVIPYAGRDHRRVHLAAGTSRDAVFAAAIGLRADPRVSFVGPAYTTATGAKMVLINRLVVRFKEGVAQPEINRLIDSLGARVLRAAAPDSAKPTWWLAYPKGRDPLTVAAELQGHPLVQWAEPDRLTELRPASHVPSDPFYANQYYLKNSIKLNGIPVDDNVQDAWLLTKGSSAITVAVLGGGIDGSHAELQSRRKSGPCFDGWDEAFVEPDYTGSAWSPAVQDCSSGTCTQPPLYPDHETAVAGIVAAQHNGVGTVGVAPNVMLVSARIILPQDFNVSATPAQVADAIRWGWQTCGADVVNGSFSEPTLSTDIAQAIEDGAAQGRSNNLGAIFVFSGGNPSDRAHGSLGPVQFPAALPVTIAVGAINRWGGITNYSPSGSVPPIYQGAKAAPDLIAPSGHNLQGPQCPGTPADSAPDVYTTDIAGVNGECSGDYEPDFTGTSATAPQVAGAAALLLSLEPNLTQAQVKSRLLDSAAAWGPAADYGAGKLNIARALGVVIPPISSVSIGGPSRVKPNTTCMWWATVSGGTPPYTYSWYRNGYPVGNGDYVYVATGTTNFTMALTVQDRYEQTGSASRGITVTSSALNCPTAPPPGR